MKRGSRYIFKFLSNLKPLLMCGYVGNEKIKLLKRLKITLRTRVKRLNKFICYERRVYPKTTPRHPILNAL